MLWLKMLSADYDDDEVMTAYMFVLQYLLWSFLWLAWNLFILCLYLSIGILTKVSNVLSVTFTLYKFF